MKLPGLNILFFLYSTVLFCRQKVPLFFSKEQTLNTELAVTWHLLVSFSLPFFSLHVSSPFPSYYFFFPSLWNLVSQSGRPLGEFILIQHKGQHRYFSTDWTIICDVIEGEISGDAVLTMAIKPPKICLSFSCQWQRNAKIDRHPFCVLPRNKNSVVERSSFINVNCPHNAVMLAL